MEIPKFLSNAGCNVLSDSIDFTHGVKLTGTIGFKVAAIATLGIATIKLCQYAIGTDRKQHILPPNLEVDSKGIRFIPPTTSYLTIPIKDGSGKESFIKLPYRKAPEPSIAGKLGKAAVLGACAVVTYTLCNTLERGLRASSSYFQCKA
ncbi:MAG: hypothetical protein K2Y01_07480 [Rhabdochlamydiaceae bacterium]|nr:hypothetical protein [Rhabdochlamydiaceae bacterium]